jgi:lysyl-tRNA synthetase, class I
MHWSLDIAQKLIEDYPETETFVCASGISPSGSVHIGNFRELVTTHFVVKALQKLGKKTKFIFSWDDFDRFRKVPQNVDESFKQYLGMPYSDIPDPYGCCESYARHFQSEFEAAIKEFGIEVEFLYQNKEYKSGRYNKHIITALNKRREIYDILMEYKSQDATPEERENFYPVSLYCKSCNKDMTKIHSYDDAAETLDYTCKCGHSETLDLNKAGNIKLQWKIDWPMRWMSEKVIFEPGGRDHSSASGSFVVSSHIAKDIFDYNPPEYVGYEFIGIKGAKGKMSSSSGKVITPAELINLYIPESILYLFAKYNPATAFNIGFDEDIIRNYTEFERYYAKRKEGEFADDVMNFTMELADLSRDLSKYPKYGMLVGLLPIINFNMEILEHSLEVNGEDVDHQGMLEISEKIKYWITNWYPDRAIKIREEKNSELYDSLDDEMKEAIKRFVVVVENSEDLIASDLMSAFYAIYAAEEDPKVKKKKQRELFKVLYMLLIDRPQGPRLSLLVKVIGIETTLNLVSF